MLVTPSWVKSFLMQGVSESWSTDSLWIYCSFHTASIPFMWVKHIKGKYTYRQTVADLSFGKICNTGCIEQLKTRFEARPFDILPRAQWLPIKKFYFPGLSGSQDIPRAQWLTRHSTLVLDDSLLGEITPQELRVEWLPMHLLLIPHCQYTF